MDHIRKAILACNFLPWALNSLYNKLNHRYNNHNGQTITRNQPNNTNTEGSNNRNISIAVPYTKGLEKFRGPAKSWGSRCMSKATTPSEPFSWPPRTKTVNSQKVG